LNNNRIPGNVIPRPDQSAILIIHLTTPLRIGRLGPELHSSGSQANNRDGLHWRYDYNINEKNTFFFRSVSRTPTC
jgi:hypothetical protein